MNIKSLIDISTRMDIDGRYASFYSFSCNYLLQLKLKDVDSTDKYFAMLKIMHNNANDNTVKKAFGKIGGEIQIDTMKKWCNIILENKDLHELNIDELHYVMGNSFRLAFINSKVTVADNSQNDFNIQKSGKPVGTLSINNLKSEKPKDPPILNKPAYKTEIHIKMEAAMHNKNPADIFELVTEANHKK